MGVRGALLAVLVVLLAGCSTGSPPASTDPAPAQPGPTGSAEPAPGLDLPPRPRDVPIDGVDPCTLLTDEQKSELGLNGTSQSEPWESGTYQGAVVSCVTTGFEPRAIAVGINLAIEAGIEIYDQEGLAVDVRPLQVAGFPAVFSVNPQLMDSCTVVVDVAPQQVVDIQFRDGGRKPPIPQDQLCQDAEHTAGLVMETLLSAS